MVIPSLTSTPRSGCGYQPSEDTPLFGYMKHDVVAPNYFCDYGFGEKKKRMTSPIPSSTFRGSWSRFPRTKQRRILVFSLLASKKGRQYVSWEIEIPGQCDPAIEYSNLILWQRMHISGTISILLLPTAVSIFRNCLHAIQWSKNSLARLTAGNSHYVD